MTAQRDIDFLRQPALVPRLIYKYRSGRLLGALRTALVELAADHGYMSTAAEPANFYGKQTTGLFKCLVICDWREPGRQDVQRLKEVLGHQLGYPLAVLIPDTSALFADKDWRRIAADCHVLLEQRIAIDNLEDYIAYFASNPRLSLGRTLAQSQPFLSHLRDRLDGQTWDIPRFELEVDRAAVLHTDPLTGEFQLDVNLHAESKEMRAEILRPLRALTTHGSEPALLELSRGLARRYHRGTSPTELTDELCRLTGSLLAEVAHTQKPRQRFLITWAVLLALRARALRTLRSAKGKDRFGPDLFLTEIQQLGLAFIRRCGASYMLDPLVGLWPSILGLGDGMSVADADRQQLAVGGPAASFPNVHAGSSLDLSKTLSNKPAALSGLVGALATYVEGRSSEDLSWIDRLSLCLQAAPVATRRSASQGPALSSLRDVVGNRRVISSLIEDHVQADIRMPIVLSGPDNVGKFTVARALTRSLICESKPRGFPCEACATCRDSAGGFGILQVNVKTHDREAVQTMKHDLGRSSFAAHRVVILENVDFNPAATDALLKTMEEGIAQATFIICARDANRIGGALRSRCVEYALRPLSKIEMGQLLDRFLAHLGALPIEKSAQELCFQLAAGLPGRLYQICEKVATARAFDSADVLRALDMIWGDWALRYWSFMLGAGAKPVAQLTDIPTAVQRLRLALVNVRSASLDLGFGHPALDNAPEDSKGALRNAWREAVLRNGGDNLWQRLSGLWIAADAIDAIGFERLVRQTSKNL